MGRRSLRISQMVNIFILGILASSAYFLVLLPIKEVYEKYREERVAKKELEKWLDYINNSV